MVAVEQVIGKGYFMARAGTAVEGSELEPRGEKHPHAAARSGELMPTQAPLPKLISWPEPSTLNSQPSTFRSALNPQPPSNLRIALVDTCATSSKRSMASRLSPSRRVYGGGTMSP